MSNQLFAVEQGLDLDGSVQILYGANLPGLEDFSSNAGIGSIYYRTDGGTYKKIKAGSGSDKWTLENDSGIRKLTAVTGTNVVDQVFVDDTLLGCWLVTVTKVSNAAIKYSTIIYVAHNGTDAADATDIRFNEFSKLKFGSIAGLSIDAALSGTDTAQVIQVAVTSSESVNVESHRVGAAQGAATSPLSGNNTINTFGITNVYTKTESDSRYVQAGSLPNITITDTFVVASQAAMLALTAEKGDVAVRTDTNTTYILAGTSASTLADWQALPQPSAVVPYDLAGGIAGKPAVSDQVLMMAAVRAFTIPANFAGSVAKVGTVGTGAVTLTVKKNGTQVGTISFSAAGSTGTFSTQAAIVVAAGDLISITAPATQDSTFADVYVTLLATA